MGSGRLLTFTTIIPLPRFELVTINQSSCSLGGNGLYLATQIYLSKRGFAYKLLQMKNVLPIPLFREMVWESQNMRPSRLLGLQIGATHVGVAISHVKGPIDFHCVLERKKSNIMASELRNLIRELSVGGIVVGVPFDIREKNPGKNLYEVFVDELNKAKKLKEVPYVIWDDSWSGSQTINCLLDPFPLNPEVKKVLRDEEIRRCATGILQSFLNYGRLFAVTAEALEKCDRDTRTVALK